MAKSSTGKTGRAPTTSGPTEGNDKLVLTAGSGTGEGGMHYLGLGGADTFVFSKDFAGTFYLDDFAAMNEGNDQLDLSAFFGVTAKKMNSRNIDQYVQVTWDGKLLLDASGSGDFSESQIWAVLADIEGQKVHLRIGNFNGGYVVAGDEHGPIIDADPAGDLDLGEDAISFEYNENQTAGATLATVTAQDPSGVVAWRFVDSNSTTSQDGLFQIDANGNISLTDAGAAAAANDYETLDNLFSYQVQAQDGVGNWSDVAQVSLSVLDLDDQGPVFEGEDSDRAFDYTENQTEDAVVGTVSGFTDNVDVTTYRFAGEDADGVDQQLSMDGYYRIDDSGNISITAAGVAAGVAQNDYETDPNDFWYAIQAGDAAGNWSEGLEINLNVINDASDDGPAGGKIYVLDATTRYIRGAGTDEVAQYYLESGATEGFQFDEDTALGVTASSYGYTLNGVDFSGGSWEIDYIKPTLDGRLYDADGVNNPHYKLDLSGFGSDDKVVFDYQNFWTDLGTYTTLNNATGRFAGYVSSTSYTYGAGSATEYVKDWGFFLNSNNLQIKKSTVIVTRTGGGSFSSYPSRSTTDLASWDSSTSIARDQITVLWPEVSPPASGGHIFVTGEFDPAPNLFYLDDGDGIFEAGEDAVLYFNEGTGKLSPTDGGSGIDYDAGEWTVEWLAGPEQSSGFFWNAPALNLTGFGGDDQIIVHLENAGELPAVTKAETAFSLPYGGNVSKLTEGSKMGVIGWENYTLSLLLANTKGGSALLAGHLRQSYTTPVNVPGTLAYWNPADTSTSVGPDNIQVVWPELTLPPPAEGGHIFVVSGAQTGTDLANVAFLDDGDGVFGNADTVIGFIGEGDFDWNDGHSWDGEWTVEFLGSPMDGYGHVPVNLNGFDSDDKIIVNFAPTMTGSEVHGMTIKELFYGSRTFAGNLPGSAITGAVGATLPHLFGEGATRVGLSLTTGQVRVKDYLAANGSLENFTHLVAFLDPVNSLSVGALIRENDPNGLYAGTNTRTGFGTTVFRNVDGGTGNKFATWNDGFTVIGVNQLEVIWPQVA
jgi:hypothetical protein